MQWRWTRRDFDLGVVACRLSVEYGYPATVTNLKFIQNVGTNKY